MLCTEPRVVLITREEEKEMKVDKGGGGVVEGRQTKR